ncbi:MAG: DMT family transporter [Negativicutes bacterium]
MQDIVTLPKIWVHLELAVVVAIWAGTFVSTKIVLTEISPALSALYRYLLASVILLILDWKNTESIAKGDYPMIVLLSSTGVTLYYLLQHYGIQYTNATDAAILISLSPIFMCLISWFCLRDSLKISALAGVLISFCGCLLVITDGHFDKLAIDDRFEGNLLILLTAVSWAVYSSFGKNMLQKYSVRTLVKSTTLIGTLLLLPFSLYEISPASRFSLSWIGWVNMLYLGGLASVYGYLAWYRGLCRLPAATVGSYLYFRPLLTGVIAAMLLHEQIGSYTVIGAILILFGTYLTTR